ncbi:IS5 family transposase [Deinococcus pimensis]|uniref:IS5 family transposase n=1 Tax=Deinococcus pimensis TaxID=309888 RepID=UPI0009FEBFD7|nr:IS5 family transposase [Deinococcus pimensis]
MSRRLTDAQWHFIRPLLPPPSRLGRPRADDRRTLDAILYVLRTGIAWRDLPRDLGSPITAWRRLKHWQTQGIWKRLWHTALNLLEAAGQLDWSHAQLDASFVPAKRGGLAVGLTRKGKGTKWMLVTDANGTPIGFHLASAGLAESTLGPVTLESIIVTDSSGRCRTRPQCLVADRAYDTGPFRRYLHRRGIRACIPVKRRPKTWKAKRGRPVTYARPLYGARWRIERTFAWPQTFRRLLVRWERDLHTYTGLFTLALIVLVLRRRLQ